MKPCLSGRHLDMRVKKGQSHHLCIGHQVINMPLLHKIWQCYGKLVRQETESQGRRNKVIPA